MKSYMILCCALVAVAQTARAQNPTIDQQIEVTRQYVPEVEGARKLDYRPRMNDTVMLKPEIDYAIRPTPWRSVFGTEPIAPVGISTAEYARPYPYYLRLGGGYPGQSLLDFAVDKSTRTTRFGVLLNHYGEWQRRQIPVTEGASLMPWTTNDVGIYAGRDFGRQSLDFRADLQLDYFDAFRLTDTRQGYFNQDLDVRIGYGDDFTDLSRFNYRVALSGGIAQLAVGYGRAEVNLGGRVGDGALLGDVIFDGWWTSSEASTGSCDWYVALAPRYEATFGRFGLHAGLGVYVNRYKGIRHAGDETYNDAFYRFFILPDIDLSYQVADAFVPYLRADGEQGDGSYRGQHMFNPYAQGDQEQRPRIMYFGGGFRGQAASILTYDVQVGYSLAEVLNFKLMDEAAPAGGLLAGGRGALQRHPPPDRQDRFRDGGCHAGRYGHYAAAGDGCGRLCMARQGVRQGGRRICQPALCGDGYQSVCRRTGLCRSMGRGDVQAHPEGRRFRAGRQPAQSDELPLSGLSGPRRQRDGRSDLLVLRRSGAYKTSIRI